MTTQSETVGSTALEAATLGVAPSITNDRRKRIQQKLAASDQAHLLSFIDEVEDSRRETFLSELEELDFELLQELSETFRQRSDDSFTAEQFAEPLGFVLDDEKNRFSRESARIVGEAILRAGTVGVVIVAGGQGTRLGFAHPKGMFPISPVGNATLFEILFQKIRAVETIYETTIPIYLMTSPATHEETIAFLESNHHFGINARNVSVFCQGTMPAVDMASGKILLSEKAALFRSPDGHGGMLDALRKNQCLDDMRIRGIEQLFYMQIDNALVDVASPEALGFHTLANSDATTMVIRKSDPMEKVGNVAMIDGKTQIVEYSDLPEAVARQTSEQGGLQIWAGNVAVHVWNVGFLREQASSRQGLPFHFAKKKVPFVNDKGELIEPNEPNGVKFERFVFDLLPAARNSIVVEVDRESFFAPLKNPAGTPTDSPEYVQAAMRRLHHGWLESAGAEIAEGVTIEISPSFAIRKEQVAGKVEPGTKFTKSQVLT